MYSTLHRDHRRKRVCRRIGVETRIRLLVACGGVSCFLVSDRLFVCECVVVVAIVGGGVVGASDVRSMSLAGGICVLF